MRRFWVALVMILGGALMGVLGLTENTAAIASKDSILKLAELQGVYDCYVSNHVDTSVYQNSFNNATNKAGFITRGTSQSVLLPTGFTSDAGSKITCKVLFTDNKKGLPKLGYSMPNTAAGLGYTASGNKYVINNTKTAAATTVKNITGGGSIGAGKAQSVSGGTLYQWDNKAKYALYYYYLENLNAGKFVEQGSCGSTKPSGYTSYYRKSSSEWCGIKVNSDLRSIPLHIPTNAGYRMKVGTASDVLAFLANSDSYKGFSDSDYVGSAAKLSVAEGVTEEGDDGEAEISSSEACYQAGVTSQSWFLCPTMENMSVFADGIDSMISDWLTVDTNLYDGSSNTYTIWEIMRNIANIALVLVLLAVIFSQLTGWGIDNYGIKKILPRLIAMAIVVNLSFIACQLVIDVSNILGESLHNMFASIGAELAGGEEHLNGFVPGMIAAILGAVTGAGVIGSIGITIGTTLAGGLGPMAVILIVMALLSIVIAVLMFFLMLGARMVLVVLCTAVAPVVAVLYILPNTQNWAKKWWKVFWAMLVMYPICGAVLGISTLIKGMVVQGGTVEIWMAVVGMVGPFLPFFMLPSMLRSAISMLGSVGAALVNASQSVRKGAGDLANTVQNTAAAQNQMKIGQANLNRRLAGLDANGHPTKRGRRMMENASPRRQRLLAMRMGLAQKDASEMEEAAASMTNAIAATGIPNATEFAGGKDAGGFDAGTREAYYANQFAAAAKAGDITEMNAALIAARNGGMRAKDMARMVRVQVNEEGGFGNLSAENKAAWMRNLSASQNGAFLSKDFELKHFMQNGGTSNGGRLGGYGEYARSAPINPDDINPEDIAAMSGDSLAGMIASGAITAGMAQSVLATNPNISEDKKIMLGALAHDRMRLNNPEVGPPEDYDRVASDIKNEAKNIMKDKNASGRWIGGSAEERQSWTESPAQRVEVVGGGQVQQQPQSGGGVLLTEGDSVRIHGQGGNPSAQGGWTPQAMNQARQEWQQSQPGMQGRDGWSANSRDQARREWEDSQK